MAHLLRAESLALFTSLTIGATAQTSTTWTIDSLSQSRGYLTATAAGTKILFAGGSPDGSAVSKRVDIYNTSTGTWTIDSLSEARADLAAVAMGNKVFFAGGYAFNGASKRVDIYDVSTGTWTIDSLSEGRLSLVAAASGNKVLFAGGTKINYGKSNRVDIYDASTNTWTVDSLSLGRSDLAAVTLGNRILFAGGASDPSGFSTVPTNRVDIYNVSTSSWTIDSLSESRMELAGAGTGTKALFAGGINNDRSKRVDIYNASTGTWAIDSLSQKRSYLAASTIGSKVLFGGGNTSTNTGSNRVDIYDASSGIWSLDSLSKGRSNLAAATSGNKLLFGGGSYTKRVDIYTLNTVSPGGVTNVMQSGVSILPNPSNGAFILNLETTGNVRILNAAGQVVVKTRPVAAGIPFTLGEELRPGVYYIEVRFIGTVRTLRVVKL